MAGINEEIKWTGVFLETSSEESHSSRLRNQPTIILICVIMRCKLPPRDATAPHIFIHFFSCSEETE